ncbi:MAG: tetratricopeptide repeat protein [Desulfurivibrionaceae bacterium]
MGDKSVRKRQHFLFYLTVSGLSLALQLAACAPVQNILAERQAQQLLSEYRHGLATGFYETVIEQSQKVLRESETNPPADLALYALGEAYADHVFEGRDYNLSRQYFEKLIRNFPYSPLSAEARTFVTLYDAIAEKHHMQQLSKYRNDLAAGFFETVVQQSKNILRDSETKPSAELALYALGEAYADHAFKGRDYNLSRQYFEKLIRNFPYSPLASEAKNFIGLYDVIAEKDRTVAALRKQTARAGERRLGSSRRPVVENQKFEEAIRRNQQILREAGTAAPADEALYNLGLIYAHVDNPAKDYRKARDYFAQISRNFPNSPLAEHARVWLGLFEVFESMQQIDLEIEKQKMQLNR